MRLAPASVAVVLVAFLTASTFLSAKSVSIQTAHDSPSEQQAKPQLERLLKQYGTTSYTLTHNILIEERAIPRGDPVLTLNTHRLTQGDEACSTYLHEQIHWFLSSREQQTEAAEADLKKLYADPPIGGQDGAQDLESGYLHLIVCEPEREADVQLLGSGRTTRHAVVGGRSLSLDLPYSHADHDKIRAVIKSDSLEIP